MMLYNMEYHNRIFSQNVKAKFGVRNKNLGI